MKNRSYVDRSLSYNKLLLHSNLVNTLADLNNLRILLPNYDSYINMDFSLFGYPPDAKALMRIETKFKYKLNSKVGQKYNDSNILICAYDESVHKFTGLEGIAYFTSHSLVILKDDYIPLNLITFYFYTRSKSICDKSRYVKYSDDPESDFKRDYVNDRNTFLLDNVPENSILLIDGPLIGKQMSSKTRILNEKLLDKEILPIFFVKNSSSNLVTDYDLELRGKFNSDMHWAYKLLRVGERSCMFKYTDQSVTENAKIFFYLKSLDLSPQRIEFDITAYKKYNKIMNGIFDLIYYLILAQGDNHNPQIRPIAIAEKFARSTINLIDIEKIMKHVGLIPSINQERFG